MATDPTIATLFKGICISAEQILAALDSLSEEELNWRPPVADSNSLCAIATHAFGSIEQRMIETIGGQPVRRDRDAEFVAAGASSAALRERWQSIRSRSEAALAGVPADALQKVIEHNNLGRMTQLELLLHVGRHTSEHAGEAQLTRMLAKAAASRA